jgi:hypothetical protein
LPGRDGVAFPFARLDKIFIEVGIYAASKLQEELTEEADNRSSIAVILIDDEAYP